MSKSIRDSNFNTLQFDTMEPINVDKAKIYISQYESSLHESVQKHGTAHVDKAYTPFELRKIFLQISNAVELHSTTFGQLEYIHAGIHPQEVAKTDIKLIAKAFRDANVFKKGKSNTFTTTSKIHFTVDVPLAVLGLAADMLASGKTVIIGVEEDAPLPRIAACHLFVSICLQAGLRGWDINYSKDLVNEDLVCPPSKLYTGGLLNPEWVWGCAGVVTARADADSAAAALSDATHHHQYPWRLRRVLVQEEIFERFKLALERKATKPTFVDEAVNNVCEALTIGSKVFLFDYPNPERDLDIKTPYVLVEAYRTTKELLNLLKRYDPLYISLWCNDISTTQEITFSSQADIVWVNDYGNFEDLGYYDMKHRERRNFLVHKPANRNIAKPHWHDKAMKLRTDWLKLDLNARKDIILEFIDSFTDEDNAYMKNKDELKAKVATFTGPAHSFRVLKDGVTVSGRPQPPAPVVFVQNERACYTHSDFVAVFRAALSGTAIVLRRKPFPKVSIIPVVVTEEHYTPCTPLVNLDSLSDTWTREKYVYTRFGETFAN